MRIICRTQRTAEWFSERAGRCTASRAGDFMAKLSRASKSGGKGDWAAAHWNYVSELAWERITGVPTEHYVSGAMEIGSQYEGEAKVEYWQRFGIETDDIGLVLHPRYDYLAASPDALVGLEGLAEFKVPTFRVHCSYLETGEIPADYQLQMQVQMLCCERPWNDFVSYMPADVAPEMPEEFRMFRKRLEFDPNKAPEIEEAATATSEHVAERMETLRRMYPSKGAPKSKNNVEWERSVEALEASEDVNDFNGKAYEFLDSREMVP